MNLVTLNRDVAAVAERGRLRTARLEDGELVIRLRGAEVNRAHAGAWGVGRWYVLLECGRPGAASRVLSAFDMQVAANDAGVLAIGDEAGLLRVFATGPVWARPRRRRPEGSAEHLAAFRMPAYRTSSEAFPGKSPAGLIDSPSDARTSAPNRRGGTNHG
jgi:hypothetical protein